MCSAASLGYFNGTTTQTVNSEPLDFAAGINRRASLYLKMAYAVEGY